MPTSKKLIIMRHAKSGWDNPMADDFDRVLNPRGRAAAALLGAWLRDNAYVPDEVIVSSAARTQQTWQLVKEGGALSPTQVRIEDSLYLASEMTLLQQVKRATGNCVLVIAHNPGIAEFADALVATPPAHPQFMHYPTCATTVLQSESPNWADLALGQNSVVDFIVPRDLS